MKKWMRILGFGTLIVTLPLSTSSSALATPSPKTENLESLGSADPNEEKSQNLLAEAHIAEKTDSGNMIAITWSVKNNGDSAIRFNWPSGTSYMYSQPVYFSGVTAVSSDGSTRHHPIMDGASDCLCSGQLSLDFKGKIGPGEQVAYWSMYSVPEDVDTITLEIPGFEPIENIPIS